MAEQMRQMAAELAALRKSRADSDRAQALAHVGSWRLDVRNNVLLWSDQAYDIFGIPKETPLKYETFLECVHPEDRKYVDGKWQAALRGADYDIEHRILVGQNLKWVREKACLEFDDHRNLLGGFGITQDITQRKNTEDKLRKAKNEWENTFNTIPDLIGIFDQQFRIVRVNRAMAERLGKTIDECIGLTCYETVHGVTGGPPAFCPHAKTLATGKEHVAEIHEPILDGDFIVSTTPMFDEHGCVTGSIHVARDITKRKKAEQQLRQTSDYLEKLFNYANAPIICWDPERKITRFNRAFENLTGYKAAEVIGRDLDMLFPEDTRRTSLESIRRTLTEYWEVVEIPILRKDGRTRTALWNSANIYAKDGKTVIATIAQGQDITERKQAEKDRQKLYDMLADKNKELQSIVYVASHDLRSPLLNVYGFSGQLAEQVEELRTILNEAADIEEAKEKAKDIFENQLPENLAFIKAGAEKMQMLINGLLTVSRIGTVPLHIETIDMNKLFAKIVRAVSYEAKEKDAQINVRKLPPCKGDANQINQLFSNIVSNALKYLDPQRKGQIEVTAKQEGGMNVYSVCDNGIGIAPEHKEKIFEIFHRLDPKNGTAGEGLGLSIVLRIVDRHAGRISVQSTPEKGSTFHVALPKA